MIDIGRSSRIPLPKNRDRGEHDGNHNPGPRGVGSEHPARQGKNERMASGRAPAGASAYAGETGHPELPIEVNLDAGRHLEAVHIHEQAKERHQRHGDKRRYLLGNDAPVDSAQVARPEGGPKPPFGDPRHEESQRLGVIHRDVENEQPHVIERAHEHDAPHHHGGGCPFASWRRVSTRP